MSEPEIQDFELPSTGERPFRLSDHRGQNLVVYFYPRDSTSGCTLEAQEFRDLHAEFRKAGTAIVGISRDSLKSHERFKAAQNLPFELLSDAGETACERFGVMKLKTLYGKQVRGIERSTFVFDKDGRLVKSWRGVKAGGHAAEVLAFVRTLP